MTSFIPVAPCVPRWMQSIPSAVLLAFSSLYWSIAAIASCRFVPITLGKICRPRCANKFRCACKKPITHLTQCGWKNNDCDRAISGERTRLACWRARPRDRELLFGVQRAGCGDAQRKTVSARRRTQHASRLRSPDPAIAAAVDVPIMTTRWTRKDLLGLRELTSDEINFVLETTDAFKQVGTREIKKVPALRGKTLVNFFVEPSTRTRTSFELAAFRLSADVINISATTSSLTKGETLKDTARNLEALQADIIVLRHSSAGAPQFLACRL